jgi:two-component system, cell cycle sensor histidine kinase and response regulator CckA
LSSPNDVERPLHLPGAADPLRLAEFLQAVIRTAAEGICIFTPIAEFPFIRISVWNNRLIELTGYTMAEVNERGWHVALFPDPQLQQQATAGMKELIAGRDLGQVEWPITRKDGSKRLLAISTSRVLADDGPTIVVLVTDITDRRLADAALRRSEERLAEAQRAARLGSWDWDVRSGAFWWSDELYRRYGKDRATFHPSRESYVALAHPDDRGRVNEAVASVLDDGTSVNTEHRFLYPDGSVGWSQMHAFVERDARGVATRMWGTCQDITERKQAAEARQALEDRLGEARRLESIGVLTGGMAHEFNNLLTLILGHVDLAEAELPANSPMLTHLVPMRTAGLRAAELCRQMLAYAGKGRLVLGSVPIAPLVTDVTTGLAIEVAIDLELKAELPPVRGDVEQLRQLVANLLTNAAEAVAGTSGRVRLATYEHRLDAQAAAQLRFTRGLLPNTYVALEVRDDGPGMDESTLTRAFEPFFSTKFPGRGLGLPVVLGVLRTHGGGLNVETAPGCGTTVRVYLPIAGR